MTDPILALRRAIHALLVGDATLTGLLGGPRVYDDVSRGASGVYVAFGEAKARDWSTGSERGHAHDLALVVWSKPGGAAPALLAAAQIATLLEDAAPALDGHRLVLLRVVAEEARRDDKADLARVTLKLAALTEVI